MSDKTISDRELDVAVFKMENIKYYFEIEDNPDYSIGQTVKLVGYTQHIKGNSIDIREVRIASRSYYLGQVLYIVDGNIFHGASGGPVLNMK